MDIDSFFQDGDMSFGMDGRIAFGQNGEYNNLFGSRRRKREARQRAAEEAGPLVDSPAPDRSREMKASMGCVGPGGTCDLWGG